jgi:hypothetical protein
MLVLFRIVLTALFLWLMMGSARDARANLNDDVNNAGMFAVSVVVGLLAGLTWAPVLGRAVAGPMTGLMTDGSVSDDRTGLIRFARRCEARGWRRMAVAAAFAEAVRHPNLPAAFVVGMNNSRAGSWLERAFAREVWHFNNVANCVRAHGILRLRHDEDPGPHEQGDVNMALMAHLREPAPDPGLLTVPEAAPMPLPRRNSRIRLFGSGSEPGRDKASPDDRGET